MKEYFNLEMYMHSCMIKGFYIFQAPNGLGFTRDTACPIYIEDKIIIKIHEKKM